MGIARSLARAATQESPQELAARIAAARLAGRQRKATERETATGIAAALVSVALYLTDRFRSDLRLAEAIEAERTGLDIGGPGSDHFATPDDQLSTTNGQGNFSGGFVADGDMNAAGWHTFDTSDGDGGTIGEAAFDTTWLVSRPCLIAMQGGTFVRTEVHAIVGARWHENLRNVRTMRDGRMVLVKQSAGWKAWLTLRCVVPNEAGDDTLVMLEPSQIARDELRAIVCDMQVQAIEDGRSYDDGGDLLDCERLSVWSRVGGATAEGGFLSWREAMEVARRRDDSPVMTDNAYRLAREQADRFATEIRRGYARGMAGDERKRYRLLYRQNLLELRMMRRELMNPIEGRDGFVPCPDRTRVASAPAGGWYDVKARPKRRKPRVKLARRPFIPYNHSGTFRQIDAYVPLNPTHQAMTDSERMRWLPLNVAAKSRLGTTLFRELTGAMVAWKDVEAVNRARQLGAMF